MKCRFCGKSYTANLSFSSLFREECACKRCQKIHKTNLLFECIPYQMGMIEYYYFYDAEFPNTMVDSVYGAMIDKPLYLAISQQKICELVLFIEETEFHNFPKWSFILFLFLKVMFISSRRFDFETFVMLF